MPPQPARSARRWVRAWWLGAWAFRPLRRVVREVHSRDSDSLVAKGPLAPPADGSTQVIAAKPAPAQLGAVIEAARSVSRDLGWKGQQ